MKNTNFKQTFQITLIVIAAVLATISFAAAANADTFSAGAGAVGSGDTNASVNSGAAIKVQPCVTLSTFAQDTLGKIADRANTLQNQRDQQLSNLQAAWVIQDASTTASRQEANETKESDFAALEAQLAVAPASQKQALVTFESSMNTAATVREQSVDAATQTFRTAVENLLEDRTTSIQSAINDFTNSVQNSLTVAQSECAASQPVLVSSTIGVNGGNMGLRANLKTEIDTARQKFQGDSRLSNAGPVNIMPLTVKYQAAINAATAAFKTQVLQAQTAFNAALQ